MTAFSGDLLLTFFISIGVVVGGAFFGSLAGLLSGQYPLATMATLAERLKLWAMVAALGGTFATIRSIESGLFEGQLTTVLRQMLYILVAFAGANLGWLLVSVMAGRR